MVVYYEPQYAAVVRSQRRGLRRRHDALRAGHDPDEPGPAGIDGVETIRRLRLWTQILIIDLDVLEPDWYAVEVLDSGALRRARAPVSLSTSSRCKATRSILVDHGALE
jgi:hypothetical protein